MTRHNLEGSKEELVDAIDNCVVGFRSHRNREIIKDHFVEGLTYEEVAEKHKMSVWQVKNISYRYEPIISNYLKRS